jgi:hypothetical protein
VSYPMAVSFDCDSEMTLTLVSQAGICNRLHRNCALYCDGTVTLTAFEKELSMFSELTEVTT